MSYIHITYLILTTYFVDKDLNLDSLLLQVRTPLTPKWYQFGLAVGIKTEILERYSGYPPEECLVEMLDYWLRSCKPTKATWRNVAKALKKIGLQQLAENILKAYETGYNVDGYNNRSLRVYFSYSCTVCL